LYCRAAGLELQVTFQVWFRGQACLVDVGTGKRNAGDVILGGDKGWGLTAGVEAQLPLEL